MAGLELRTCQLHRPAWWAGQALFGTLTWSTAMLTYSLAGLGIAVVNDFKAWSDRELGLILPVVFGIERAAGSAPA